MPEWGMHGGALCLESPNLRPEADMIIAVLAYGDSSVPGGRVRFDLAGVA